MHRSQGLGRYLMGRLGDIQGWDNELSGCFHRCGFGAVQRGIRHYQPQSSPERSAEGQQLQFLLELSAPGFHHGHFGTVESLRRPGG